ncbi:MAG: C_GCAxxG_C_C family protein [Clostridiaceae bacterium]|nr:C_GCAxxG_C_C family protein [Clostridiaceae bacterium]
MTAADRAELAVDLFEQGYNCAQSVVGAWLDQTEMESDQAMRLASSFGGGMGRLREVCGALTGSFMVAGLLHGYAKSGDDEEKGKHYALIQQIAGDFEYKYKTILCRDLLELDIKHDSPNPSARTAEYYAERPCARFIYDAVILLDQALTLTSDI